jgi:putative endonuclease
VQKTEKSHDRAMPYGFCYNTVSMTWFCYVLECADGTLYTGVTVDTARRLKEHNFSNRLGSRYVRVRRPVKIVHLEEYDSRSEALRRESEIKGWSRSEKMDFIGDQKDRLKR